MIKRTVNLTLVLVAMLTAHTAAADIYYDYARVIKVRPVYETVTIAQPVEQCYRVKSRTRRHREGPVVVGAMLGGALGHAIGDHPVSTVAGAVIGGAIGHEVSRESRHHQSYDHHRSGGKLRCVQSRERYVNEQRLTGYKVRYRYKGESYHTFMRRHPGKKVKVRVKVSPAHYYR